MLFRSIVAKITPLVPELIVKHQQKIVERLQEALGIAAPDTNGNGNIGSVSREEVAERIRQEVTMYGIRIDITEEYARAFEEQGLDYVALKSIARMSLEHGFIEGKSLWSSRDDFTATVTECASDVLGAAPSTGCASFLAANAKAKVQWQHESDVAAFEATAP